MEKILPKLLIFWFLYIYRFVDFKKKFKMIFFPIFIWTEYEKKKKSKLGTFIWDKG